MWIGLIVFIFTIVIPLALTPLEFILGKFKRGIGLIATSSLTLSLLCAIYSLSMIQYLPGNIDSILIGPLNALLLFITTLTSFLACIYSLGYVKERKLEYYPLLLIFSASMNGMITTDNLLLLFLFFEVSTISSILLVSHERGIAIEAALKYASMSLFGGAISLIGIGLTAWKFHTLSLTTLSLSKLKTFYVTELTTPLILGTLSTGFALKSALVPLHAWLPDAYAEAPTPISAMLSGAMIKCGIYALIISFYCIAPSSSYLLPLASLSLITIVVGGLMAFAQSDLKRMLAYCSICQVGYITLGLSLPALDAVYGGLYHTLTHAITKPLLFMIVGVLILALRTRNMYAARGLSKRLPIAAWCYLLGLLALAGIPPLSGFFSKLLIIIGCLEAGRYIGAWSSLAALVTAVFSGITLAYLLRSCHKVFFGPLSLPQSNVEQIPKIVYGPILILAILSILLGILYPFILSWIIKPAAEQLISLLGGV